MHLGMLLLILGPFSGILRNGDYGSKRVQILYICSYAQKDMKFQPAKPKIAT